MKTVKLKNLSVRIALIFLLSLVLAPLSSIKAFAAGSFTPVTYNGRTYKIYVPSGYTPGTEVPLVVMLHGCTQDPDQFAAGTQMNALAETENFLVIYPEQTSSANQNKCWNFFEPSHQRRGSGEPALIAGMVNDVKSKYSVDDDAVFVTGLSAGGAMTVVMGATYPDVFKAIGVGAGLEYKAATTMIDALLKAMPQGGPDPVNQGREAYLAMGSYARVVPTIVFHGTSDSTVVPKNGDQVLTQWATTNDYADDGVKNGSIDDIPEQTIPDQIEGGRAYTKYVYNDSTGTPIMEKYTVTGMNHAWSGGSTAGSYTDPKGPNESEITWEFFKRFIGPTVDIIPPETTATPAGGFYTTDINIVLEVNEEATTYYTLDGTEPTTDSAIYASPISLSADSEEDVVLKFFSVDLAENVEDVQTETYQFGEDTIAPVTTVSPAGGSYTGSVNVSLTVNEAATTYYTLDGTEPTTDSAVYNSPIKLTEDATLKFFSVDTAGNVEDVQTEDYIVTINFESVTATANEHYMAGRLDVTEYNAMGMKYGYLTPFTLYKVEGSNVWTDVNPLGDDPEEDTTAPITTAAPAGGTYNEAINVTLTVNETATTYYTLDGTTPTTASAVYNTPIAISEDTTLKFLSIDTAGNVEAVKTETYVFEEIQEPTYETAYGTATEHYVAGRLDVAGYNAMGAKYGYMTKFNLYRVEGSTTWTDVQPQ